MRVKKDDSQAEVAAGAGELQDALFTVREDGTAEELVTQADYASLAQIPCGVWSPDAGIGIEYAERVGDSVYFLLDYGVAAPTGSMGWRTAYTRTGSALFRKDLATGQVETLYTY